MMNNSLKSLCKVNSGASIEGKWHRNRYTILKELGYGANGIVYLAQFQNQKVALKMCDNGMSVTSEVNVLKSFAKVQGSILGPSLIDVDDWVRGNKTVSFYVMEYIKGPDLLAFIQQKGKVWSDVLILQLLSDLQILHDKGWVFGDLKPENLIVMGPPPKIRCIDVGGTTRYGRAIKEFTEFYDRGYWGLGSRKAEPSYDLFALGMIIMNTEYPRRFNKTTGGIQQLQAMINQKQGLLKYEGVLLKVFQGKYHAATEMRKDIMNVMNGHGQAKTISHSQRRTPNRSTANSSNISRLTYKKRKKKSGLAETIIILMIISFFYIIYIYGQTV